MTEVFMTNKNERKAQLEQRAKNKLLKTQQLGKPLKARCWTRKTTN